tara:strand:+ start:40 stop:327 length:288 start_codon:yes stop_codon:yes gene_type:complete
MTRRTERMLGKMWQRRTTLDVVGHVVTDTGWQQRCAYVEAQVTRLKRYFGFRDEGWTGDVRVLRKTHRRKGGVTTATLIEISLRDPRGTAQGETA